ncbi:MAG: hypothetical protein EXR81_04890 [Gammaproteobacteria bacterium]|nr:hypothetical protein [Gammaproteobacteria bacterium]
MPSDLVSHNCLDHSDNFQFTWTIQEANKTKDISVNGNVRVNSSIDLCELAISGLGMVYLPSFTVAHAINSGQLISVLDNYRPPSVTIYAVYPTSKYLNKKTQVFLEFMVELFNPIDNEFGSYLVRGAN